MELIMSKFNFVKFALISLVISVIISSCAAFRKETQYYINFEENGGTKINNFVIDLENFNGFPEETYLDNSTFIGWFFEDDFTNEFSLEYLMGNFIGGRNTINLYAYWVSNEVYNQKYIVNFYPNNGVEINSQEYGFFEQLDFVEVPSKPYSIFDGWYFDLNFEIPVDLSNYRVKNDISLYGKWTQKYQLLYDLLDNGFDLINFTDTVNTYNREYIQLENLNELDHASEGYLIENIEGYVSYTTIDYKREYQTGGSLPKESYISIEIDYERPDFAYFYYDWGDLFDDPTVYMRGKVRINKSSVIGSYFLSNSYGNSSRIQDGKDIISAKISLILNKVNAWHNPKQANMSWD